MPELTDAISRIQTLMANVTGISGNVDIHSSTDAPTDAQIALPFIITYPLTGELTRMSDFGQELHTVSTEAHFSRNFLEKAIEEAIDVIPKMRNELYSDPTLNGQVSTIVFPIKYTFGRLDWGGSADSHIGVRFEITFKQQAGVTT